MQKKILVGLSGGVDSAVCAYLLKKAGYDVSAGFMINYLALDKKSCTTKKDLQEAKKVAKYLNIDFFTFDFREKYQKKVLNYMYDGYKKGITPNPDVICNSEIKFKIFLQEALEYGFDMIATGHYARIETINSIGKKIYNLLSGLDKNKDQSYFLSGLNQFQLSKTLFPIGDFKKEDVRKIALDIGLPNANRKDSQGICFVGKVNMFSFLQEKIKSKPGLIKDVSGKTLGEHKGIFYYTIGQRKGLNIGGQKQAIFVVKKDLKKNEIIVGTKDDIELYKDELTITGINFISLNNFSFPIKAKAKIRYRQESQDCEIIDLSKSFGERNLSTKKKIYKVKFEKKQRAITQGQICAIYLGDKLIMSGVII